MPRTKKAAGTAVDRRNGRQVELEGLALARFSLPRRDPPYLLETRKAWAALWRDPVARALTPVDRPVLLRWADALDRSVRLLAEADSRPLVEGSMGQSVANPLFGIAEKAVGVVAACEAQLGVGALNRARLGITIGVAKRTLDDLNARYAGGGDDDVDPRLEP